MSDKYCPVGKCECRHLKTLNMIKYLNRRAGEKVEE
jgi:hypothetical protein